MSNQLYTLATLLLGKKPLIPIKERVGGPQGLPG